MKIVVGLFLFLVCVGTVRGQATTPLAGTFSYPDGTKVNGDLSIKLERKGLDNTCVTPMVVAPTAPLHISIVNGAITGSPILIPTDCLSVFQPYLVTLTNTARVILLNEHWYISSVYGALVNTPPGCQQMACLGSSWISPSGLNAGNAGPNAPVAFKIANPLGGYSTAKFQGSVASGSSTKTMTWSAAFTTAGYTAVCSTLDATAPSTPPGVSITSITVQTTTTITVGITNAGGGNHTVAILCKGHKP